MNNETALALLHQAQHRITRTRKAILQAIFNFKGPFSASDLQDTLSQSHQQPHQSVDLVTIYRNLPVFEEAGIICRTDFSDEMARYMVSTPGHDHHHHHIVCRSCHQISPIDLCFIDSQVCALGQLGFKDIHHKLEFSGICAKCS